jgi:hypothetical protein
MGSWPQLAIILGLSVGIPSTVGFRPQLVVVLGLLVGIPSTVGFRPQLVIVSGLSVGIPSTVGFWAFMEPSAITEPVHKLFFHTIESWISQSPSRIFYMMEFQLSWSLSPIFTRWNFGYHGAFHKFFSHTMEFQLSWSLAQTFLSHDGISAITEPCTNFSFTRWNFSYHGVLHKLFFHTMEFRLSRSLSRIFSSTRWNLRDA